MTPITMPTTETGGFIGDLWFGHPNISTLATHEWNGREWHPRLTEEAIYKAESEFYFACLKRRDEQAGSLREVIAGLIAELKKSAEGWANALELDLIPEQHRMSAMMLETNAKAAVKKAESLT